ncbi:MAG: heme exporter protein CcmB [Leptospiraceae bacterium]|nr:heme exporter protein CcmB [Leptospiraceae bacterium]
MKQFWFLFKKEFLLLRRAIHGVLSLVSLSLIFLFIFHFSLEDRISFSDNHLLGLKWALVFLLSFILIGQSSYEERESGAFRINYLFVPAYKSFLAKTISLFLVLTFIEIFILLAFSWFFQNSKFDLETVQLNFYFLFPASFSLTAVGVSLASLSTSTRLKEIILPVLQIPLSVPVLLVGMNAERVYIVSQSNTIQSFFILLAFAVFYSASGIWIFEIGGET